MWIHLVAAALVIAGGFYFAISTTEWIMIILCIGMVMAAEIFNSAIEELTNLVSPQYNKKAAVIKDMAAGSVLVCAIVALIVGLIIFTPKIIALF